MEKEPRDAEVRGRSTRSSSHIHLRAGDADTHEPLPARDSNTLDGLRDIARGAANAARDTVYERIGDVGERFDDRTGLLTAVRTRPLMTLGLAFSAGYLLAHTRDDGDSWIVERARRQLKALIMTSIGAAVAHELRTVTGLDERFSDLLQAWLADEEEEEDFNI